MSIATRWIDNDIYGHVNNVVYYAYFDTIINRFLIDEGGLDIGHGEVIGVCAESRCTYVRSAAFPDVLDAGLRVSKIGTSSVTYEIAISKGTELCASGHFVHVFVDRATRKPTAIPASIREALERIQRR
jgi:acyl-CoA thioester hydrolase